jgi:phospholipid/cholesterol/gamma-HCH transport system substrate-binding protein
MTPTSKRHMVIVGLFVALALAILAGGILMIGDLNDTFSNKIVVSAMFDEVNGLQEGDNIWFSGLKVGRVTKLNFHGASQVEVGMKVDRDATQFIHDDALAKIGSDGLIGKRIVVLYGGTPEAPTLRPGDVLGIGKTLSTEDFLAVLQTNNTNLMAITTDLKGISARLAAGEGSVGKLLGDEVLYANLTDTVSTLNKASTNAQDLTASLSTFSAKLNREGGLPNELVTDRTSYASITGTIDQLHHAGERASNLMDGLAQGAADRNTPVGALMRDEQAGTDLKVTLDNLSRGSLLLADDLEALQHNILLRGFFRKKAKAEEKVRKEEAAEVQVTPLASSP